MKVFCCCRRKTKKIRRNTAFAFLLLPVDDANSLIGVYTVKNPQMPVSVLEMRFLSKKTPGVTYSGPF